MAHTQRAVTYAAGDADQLHIGVGIGAVDLVGFDDLPVCEYLSPPMTTVEVPKQYLGETAARRIIERIENKNSLPLKIETAVRLKKRKSV